VESHYSDAHIHALSPTKPIPPHEEDDYDPMSFRYTLGFHGDEREGRRQGLRFLKDYYPPAGCPDGVNCPECASHSGAVCDGEAEFWFNEM